MGLRKKTLLFVVFSVGLMAVFAGENELAYAIECGDMVKAEALAKEVLKQDPDDYFANLAMSFVHESRDEFAKGISCLKKCVAAEPEDEGALNALAMAYVNQGDLGQAERIAQKLEAWSHVGCVKDTLNQIKMLKAELADTNSVPVVSNILEAVNCVYQYNQTVGNAPSFLLQSVAEGRDKGKRCWRGVYTTVVRCGCNRRQLDLHFKTYPSGRVFLTREDRKTRELPFPRFSYYNLKRHFQQVKPDVSAVTAIEDPGDGYVLLRFKAGDKVVREVRPSDLLDTGVAEFKSCLAAADKVVIRKGSVSWNRSTDNDPVLYTISDPKELAEFNRLFVLVEKFSGQDPRQDELGVGCRCGGGPGIDWWKGDVKLMQIGLHHGMSLWWDGFTWDFLLTPNARTGLANWFSAHKLPLDLTVQAE